ncbi:hypothetical protein Ancab_019312 [Ancistrocladus abbreviatus]
MDATTATAISHGDPTATTDETMLLTFPPIFNPRPTRPFAKDYRRFQGEEDEGKGGEGGGKDAGDKEKKDEKGDVGGRK